MPSSCYLFCIVFLKFTIAEIKGVALLSLIFFLNASLMTSLNILGRYNVTNFNPSPLNGRNRFIHIKAAIT